MGGSGGSLWVRAGTIKLAASGAQFDASGAANAGAGRIRLERAGGDDPVALNRVLPAGPYTPPFSLQQVQSISILPAALGKKATSVQIIIPLAEGPTTALIEGSPPLVTEAISSAMEAPALRRSPPAPLTALEAASSDLRFRVIFLAAAWPECSRGRDRLAGDGAVRKSESVR